MVVLVEGRSRSVLSRVERKRERSQVGTDGSELLKITRSSDAFSCRTIGEKPHLPSSLA